MKTLEQNDWLLLNDIIYKIHTTEELEQMRKDLLNSLRFLIPYDISTFFLGDFNGDHLVCSPVGVNTSDENLNAFIDDFEDEDITSWMMHCGKSMVFKETDLLSRDLRENTRYYKVIYEGQNIHYSLQLILAYNGTFLGSISLCRSKDKIDFTERDMFIMELLKDHLNYRLYAMSPAAKLRGQSQHINFTIALEKYDLTKREMEICELLLSGYSNVELCNMLCISIHTLKKHIGSIYKKCNISSRMQLNQILLTAI